MIQALTAAGLLALAPASHAIDVGGVEMTGSGFLTLAAGRVFSGTNNDPGYALGFDGPSYVADYANRGVYESGDGITIGPDSKLGLQGMARFNDRFSVTGQVVARGARDGKVNMEWLYGNAKLNENFTVQIGRKRLPLFYYSETQDVGFAYPWVHLPQQLYGWEIVNYNGVNLLYRDSWGDWSSTINVFGGSETKKENGFWEIYYGKDYQVDSRWSNLMGAEINLARDWFEGRFVYIQSDIQNKWVTDGGTTFDPDPAPKQQIYGLAFNADYENWVVRTEFQYINRREADEEDFGKMLGVGYRVGNFLPMVTYARYDQKYIEGGVNNYFTIDEEGHSTLSFLVRWDVTKSSDIKLQVERWDDRSEAGYNAITPYAGADLITVSYDTVF
jgi:hypothetical protein